jgi:hypothetical protein
MPRHFSHNQCVKCCACPASAGLQCLLVITCVACAGRLQYGLCKLKKQTHSCAMFSKHHAVKLTSGNVAASASVAAVRYKACGTVCCTVNHPAEVPPPRRTSCCCSSALAPAPCAATSKTIPGWLAHAVKLQFAGHVGELFCQANGVTCCWRLCAEVQLQRTVP